MTQARTLPTSGGLLVVSAALLIFVSSCGGGGGGGTPSGFSGSSVPPAAPATPVAPPAYIPPRSVWETPEYYGSAGLGPINASAAYAAGATGSGEIASVIDTGVDTANPKLTNQVVGSYVVVNGEALAPIDPHGTMVAGIIAAARTGSTMMGVAFNGSLISVKAVNDTTSIFSDGDIASALRLSSGLNPAYPKVSANVINMSLAANGALPATYSAMIQAVQAGKVIVVAAGNSAGANPLYPAIYAIDPAMRGQVLAVGSVNSSNAISSFSNRAGSAASYFLVAPGENIVSTYPGAGNYGIGSGTSFAAPFVTGSIMLLEQAFPTLTAKQVVSLLLSTATSLGSSSTYGAGLINLAAAFQPQGTPALAVTPYVSGARVPLSATSMQLGPAFGNALKSAPALASAIILDAYDRPYKVNLGARIATAVNPLRATSLLGMSGSMQQISFTTGNGISIGLAEAEAPPVTSASLLAPSSQTLPSSLTQAAVVKAAIGSSTEVGFAQGLTPGAYFSPGVARETGGDLFWNVDSVAQPQLGLVGVGQGGMITRAIGASTKLSFGYFGGATYLDPGAQFFEQPNRTARLAQTVVSETLPGGVEVGIGFGALAENNVFLGTSSSGAFGSNIGGNSRFYTFSGAVPIEGGLRLEASYITADTKPGAASPFLSDWGTIRSSAFSVAAIKSGLFSAEDRFGFLVGQPLRVESASATLSLPVSRDLGNNVQWQSQRVALTPTGREIDLQVSYATPIVGGVSGAVFAILQTEPMHDAAAAPGVGLGARATMRF